jgi:purine-binding chemotaxis protein CheW
MEVVYMSSEDTIISEYSKFPWLIFKVSETKYAVNSKTITGIISLPKDITPIPSSPEYIKGIIRARGEIITLIELRNLFAMRALNNEQEQMVVSLQDAELHIGIIVDEVIGVEKINYVDKNNNVQALCSGEYIIGVGNTEKCEELILLLNDDKLTHMVREVGIEIPEPEQI